MFSPERACVSMFNTLTRLLSTARKLSITALEQNSLVYWCTPHAEIFSPRCPITSIRTPTINPSFTCITAPSALYLVCRCLPFASHLCYMPHGSGSVVHWVYWFLTSGWHLHGDWILRHLDVEVVGHAYLLSGVSRLQYTREIEAAARQVAFCGFTCVGLDASQGTSRCSEPVWFKTARPRLLV